MKRILLYSALIILFLIPKISKAQETVERFCTVKYYSGHIYVDMGRIYNHSIYADSTIEGKVNWLIPFKKDNRGIDCAYILNYMHDIGWTYFSSCTSFSTGIQFIFKRTFKKNELVHLGAD